MGDLFGEAKKTAAKGPEGLAQLAQESMTLNMTFRKLETCGKPVAAAVNGLALGGGFEIVLACTGRFAANDNPKLKLGLPEALIGLLPGAGGTQRLPRIVGLMNAAPVLIQGKQLKAAEAKGMGILHDAVPQGELIATAKQWVLDNPKAKQPWDTDKFRFPGGAPYTPKGLPMFAGASAMVRKESYGNYPAMGNILKAVYEGSQLPMDAALRVESRYFADLLLRPESQNMVRSLFLSKQSLEKGGARPAGTSAKPVKKVGVIGAGFMGAGIANVSAMSGLEVVLIDRDDEGTARGMKHITDYHEKRIKRGRSTQEKMEKIVSRVTATTDYNALDDVDLIVEAVFENSDLKNKITKMAEEVISDSAVFGTNTSTIPISDLAKASKNADKFVGIHFFSPVEKMMLVEIIRGEKTSDATLSRAVDFVTAIRKLPIIVEDTRAFYANRCVHRFIAEGGNMLSEGVKPALIENGAKMAGMPVGPLSLQDEVAIDLAYKVMQQSKADLGSQYVAGATDPIIETMMEKERYGRKNGKGFYVYDGRNKKLWEDLGQFAVNGILEEQPPVQDVKDRILYTQAIEAARCFAEGVIDDPRQADLGSIFGWGFAPFTGGVISFIDNQVGPANFVARADELAKQYGPQFEVPQQLRDMAKSGETYYGRWMGAAKKAA
jgi:3-hydroxyacyl-CoA dehydrogenase/enoyl-CoA hydratase/3-hydroxybutyryl-CoA epimerase